MIDRERYRSELKNAMRLCADQPNAIFLGQAVACPGTAMSSTFEGINPAQLLEMPVAEDMQLGMAIGMSLAGYLPICVYPRWNFLLLAMNQLVLHLDKLPLYSDYRPKVIIRVAVATDEPMNPGPQHLGDFSYAVREMLDTVYVQDVEFPDQIVRAYEAALRCDGSSIIVEHSRCYA